MKKELKKFLSRIMPKGELKEMIKLAFYNASARKGTSFSIVSGESKAFLTMYNGLEFKTVDPLYAVAEDFDFYLHFHKIEKGEVIMDAGANNGYVSLLFSKLTGAAGKVYAFEPNT